MRKVQLSNSCGEVPFVMSPWNLCCWLRYLGSCRITSQVKQEVGGCERRSKYISHDAFNSRLISDSGRLQVHVYEKKGCFFFFTLGLSSACVQPFRGERSSAWTLHLGHLWPLCPRQGIVTLPAIFLVIEFPIDRAPSARL